MWLLHYNINARNVKLHFSLCDISEIAKPKISSWVPSKKSFVNLVFFHVITLFLDHKKKIEKLYFIHILFYVLCRE